MKMKTKHEAKKFTSSKWLFLNAWFPFCTNSKTSLNMSHGNEPSPSLACIKIESLQSNPKTCIKSSTQELMLAFSFHLQ